MTEPQQEAGRGEDEPLELPPEFDREALIRCLALLDQLLEDRDAVTLTITSNFRDAVREAVEDEDYAAAYEQSRPLALALAKTIEGSDGKTRLIVYSEVFHRDRPFGDPEAVFEHESRHIQISQRSETLSDIRLRRRDEELPVQNDLLPIAGVAGEEYRVERLLAAGGYEGRQSHLEGFEEMAISSPSSMRSSAAPAPSI